MGRVTFLVTASFAGNFVVCTMDERQKKKKKDEEEEGIRLTGTKLTWYVADLRPKSIERGRESWTSRHVPLASVRRRNYGGKSD